MRSGRRSSAYRGASNDEQRDKILSMTTTYPGEPRTIKREMYPGFFGSRKGLPDSWPGTVAIRHLGDGFVQFSIDLPFNARIIGSLWQGITIQPPGQLAILGLAAHVTRGGSWSLNSVGPRQPIEGDRVTKKRVVLTHRQGQGPTSAPLFLIFSLFSSSDVP